MGKSSIIRGFKAEAKTSGWVDLPDASKYVDGKLDECTMRRNQRYIFDTYRDERYFIMEEPPGAGKSTTIKFVFADKLRRDENHRLIICIPQTFIAKSFGRVNLRFDDDDVALWDVDKNLCDPMFDVRTSKIDEVVRFLKRRTFPHDFNDRVLITTHSALAQAYERIKKLPDRASLFENMSLVVDEAHHVLYPENDETDVATKISLFIKCVVEADHETTNVWMATATFFRGDKASILPEKVLDRFKRYFLPIDQHWEENIGDAIGAFSFDFVPYVDTPFREVRALLKHQRKKTIIFCPYVGAALGDGDKLAFKDRLVEEIEKVWKSAVIVDLVTVEGREERKKEILDDAKSKDVDVILSVRIFDEGADWKFAEQIIDLAPTQSLRLQGQRNGRLWRYDASAKKNLISYYMFLPVASKNMDDESRRRRLSENFTAMTASMLIQEAVRPVGVPVVVKYKENGDARTKRVNWFAVEVPDDNKRRDILDEVCKQIMFLRSQVDEIPCTVKVRERVEMVVSDNGVVEHVAEVAVQIVKMIRQRIPNYDVDVKWMLEAGFDKVWKNEIFDMLLAFGTGMSGVKSFKDFRKIYTDEIQWIERFEALVHFVEKNNHLPYQPVHGELYYWIGGQRFRRKLGRMPSDKISKLESIPGWSWNKSDPNRRWLLSVSSLIRFVNEHGRLPRKKENKLGRWCSKQRSLRTSMTDNMRKTLELIPRWTWRVRHYDLIDSWINTAEELKNFVLVNRRYPRLSGGSKERRLNKWVTDQRMAKRGKTRGIMTSDRCIFLESIPGWEWNPVWSAKYKLVFNFANANGVLPSRHSSNQRERRLGEWCRCQKQTTRITDDKICLLEKIPGWIW